MRPDQASKLSPPDIQIGGLRIWVHTKPGPLQDGDGFTWLQITAEYAAEGARVWTDGEVLTMEQVIDWRDTSRVLLANPTVKSYAQFTPIEPDLYVLLTVPETTGQLHLKVEITPVYAEQEHTFQTGVRQEDLAGLVDQLERVVADRPIQSE